MWVHRWTIDWSDYYLLNSSYVLEQKTFDNTGTWNIKALFPDYYSILTNSNFYTGVINSIGRPYTNDSSDYVAVAPSVSYDAVNGILTITNNVSMHGWSSRGGTITISPILIF